MSEQRGSILSRYKDLPHITDIMSELVLMHKEYEESGDSFNSRASRRAFGNMQVWQDGYIKTINFYPEFVSLIKGLKNEEVAARILYLTKAIAPPTSPISRVDSDRLSIPSASNRTSVFEFASEDECTCEYHKYSPNKNNKCWHRIVVVAITRVLIKTNMEKNK